MFWYFVMGIGVALFAILTIHFDFIEWLRMDLPYHIKNIKDTIDLLLGRYM